jgi:hypothetical protein
MKMLQICCVSFTETKEHYTNCCRAYTVSRFALTAGLGVIAVASLGMTRLDI